MPKKTRTYRLEDKPYNKAVQRGKKNKTPLAGIIQNIVAGYAAGFYIRVYDKNEQLQYTTEK